MQALRTRFLSVAASELHPAALLTETFPATSVRNFWVARCLLRLPANLERPAVVTSQPFRDLDFWRPFGPLAWSLLADLQADTKLLRNDVWLDLESFNHGIHAKRGAYIFEPRFTETKSDFKLVTDIPGVEREDVKVTVSNSGILEISGVYEMADDDERGSKIASHEELKSSGARRKLKFSRSFSLPPEVDRTEIQATLRNGRLEVTLPKVQSNDTAEAEIAINVA